MLTNNRERKIHEKYSKRGEDGLVNCNSCPLIKDARFCLCKANSHYNRRTRSWEPDEFASCVVRMEMPSNCERCPMCGTESGGNGLYKLWCMCGDIPASSQRRPDNCPIICQLPEGHGRLVDADALLRDIEKYHVSDGKFQHWLELQPTIVPADLKGEK